MERTAQTIITTALEYYKKGYSVIPIGKDKKPLVQWQTHQKKRATPTQIRNWWGKYPHANVGIVTGAISGITVLDIDPKNGGEPPKGLPVTYTVGTQSGGWHYYFKYKEGLGNRAGLLGGGVDVRGEGGYVVAPPSVGEKGEYTVVVDEELAEFPLEVLGGDEILKKPRADWKEFAKGVSEGDRNEKMSQFIGKMVSAFPQKDWAVMVYPACEAFNKEKFQPPLDKKELKGIFNSITKRERGKPPKLVESPLKIAQGEVVSATLRKTQNGVVIKDMANVVLALGALPQYRDALHYDLFHDEMYFNGKPLGDKDVVAIQKYLQNEVGLYGIGKQVVYDGISQYCYEHTTDEPLDWLKTLEWDGVKRLDSWLAKATQNPNDAYHRGVGEQWWYHMVKRIVYAGCVFDHVLVVVGGQGLGKTSMFRIIGGNWYKSFTGSMDSKDFYMQMRGGCVIDLDEGASMTKTDSIKMKSMITHTFDEFRKPYGIRIEKHQRRFVFSMSTNDSESLRDMTGNRRYWMVELDEMVDFEWLIENREQLFAEAYHMVMNDITPAEVPLEEALERQEMHTSEGAWMSRVKDYLATHKWYVRGDYDGGSVTIDEIYLRAIEGNTGELERESVSSLHRGHQMEIANILKHLGFHKKRVMVGGLQKARWFVHPKKAKHVSDEAILQKGTDAYATKEFNELIKEVDSDKNEEDYVTEFGKE